MKRKNLIQLLFLCFAFTVSHAFAQEQGWTEEDRYDWYRATQGSRLIPYSWFRALEQSNSEVLFANPDNLKKFNFIYPKASTKAAKLDLPIGFTLDRQDDRQFVATRLRWKKHQKKDELWMGMNCSACHTAQIDYKGTSLVIDGGPSLIDFQSFIKDLDKALKATSDDNQKLMRFAKKVIKRPENSNELETLKKAMDRLIKWQEATARLDASDNRYGYGRLDAFGHIFNKTIMFANLEADKYETSLANMSGNPSDSPVSYPFLWEIDRQWQVQWNGIVENAVINTAHIDSKLVKAITWFIGEKIIDIGAMGRNTGEVLGVFGEAVIGKKILKDFGSPLTVLASTGFVSSVHTRNLNVLEKKVHKLTPPVWPSVLPAINTAQAKKGKALFSQYKCTYCHTPTTQEVDQGETRKPCRNTIDGKGVLNTKGTECMSSFTSSLSDIEKQAIDKAAQQNSTDADIEIALRSYTDILMACNAATYSAETGKLRGIKLDGHKLKSIDNVGTMLTASVKGVIFSNKLDLLKSIDAKQAEVVERFGFALTSKSTSAQQSQIPVKVRNCIAQINNFIINSCNGLAGDAKKSCEATKALLAYKARPLDGIWATAPFLHNGSVPTLYDLLLPVAERPTTFWVGNREFDPVKVGFVSSEPSDGKASQLSTRLDKIMSTGNSNYGHDYDNALMTDDERWALVEYMKTL